MSRPEATMSDAKRELELYAYNTRELHGQFCSIIANIKRRMKRGTYDASKAPRLWLYWVDEAARMYVREFCGPCDGIKQVFPVAERRALAAEIAASEYQSIVNGEYDEMSA